VTNNEAYDKQFPGNADDCFRVGVSLCCLYRLIPWPRILSFAQITVTRTSVNLYTEFNQSDIIVASPLGLRLAIGTEQSASKHDFDFLSSIELLIVDQV
jgi:hypothetical protein